MTYILIHWTEPLYLACWAYTGTQFLLLKKELNCIKMGWHQLAYFLLKKYRLANTCFWWLGTAFLPTAKSPSHMPRVNMQRNANANEKKSVSEKKIEWKSYKKEKIRNTFYSLWKNCKMLTKFTVVFFLVQLNGMKSLQWLEYEEEPGGFRRARPWNCCTQCPDGKNIYYRGRCVNESFVQR